MDLTTGVLQSAGVRVPVQAQPLQVLRLLLQAEGKVVTREELRKVLWPEDTFVDFELGVNTAVKKLRQALRDLGQMQNTAQSPRGQMVSNGKSTCTAPAAQQPATRTGKKEWRCSGVGPWMRNASKCSGVA